MNKESFSDESIAQLINENFIPIKVDKEERPDIDAVYMMYLQASVGQGGWPLNVFLIPDSLEPIYGGTYWAGPGVTGRGAPFENVLKAVRDIWKNENDKCRQSAKSTAEQLRNLVKAQSEGEAADFTHGVLDDVNDHFNNSFDSVNGGFLHAPKFAMPHNLSFLIRYRKDIVPEEKVEQEPNNGSDNQNMNVAEKAVFTLNKIAHGGIKDHVGSGFARYSVTEDWNLPHFEKMLYDQALLLNAYTDAYLMDTTKNKWAREYVKDLVRFLSNGSLVNEEGGFFSAQDADSLDSVTGHHREGAYYVWTDREFYKAIGDKSMADIAGMYWNVQEQGNVDPQFDLEKELAYQNVLSSQNHSYQDVAQMFGTSEAAVKDTIGKCRDLLAGYRDLYRDEPEVDRKIVTCWNGLAIGALARAGSSRVLSSPEVVDVAARAARYIEQNMYNKETHTLRRIAGADTNGMVEDYSYLISGLLDLYGATYEHEYLEWACKLQQTQIRLFWDHSSGGFFSVEEENATDLMFRPKTGFDSSEPSPNGVAVMNLYRLATMVGDETFERRAVDTLNCYGKDLTAQPFGYCSMIGGVIARMKGMALVVIVGEGDPESLNSNIVTNGNDPNTVVIRLDPQSIGFFKQQPDTVYADLYEKHGSGPIRAFMCKDRSCIPL